MDSSSSGVEITSEAQVNAQVEQLKRYLESDETLTHEQREAELKKARIALMRKLRVKNTKNKKKQKKKKEKKKNIFFFFLPLFSSSESSDPF